MNPKLKESMAKCGLDPHVYKKRIVTIAEIDKDEFDKLVNDRLNDGWDVYNITAQWQPDFGTFCYIAFLTKFVRVD